MFEVVPALVMIVKEEVLEMIIRRIASFVGDR